MDDIKTSPTLSDLQDYFRLFEKDKGWNKESVLQKCLMLGEEVGELFRSVRKEHGGYHMTTRVLYQIQKKSLQTYFRCYVSSLTG